MSKFENVIGYETIKNELLQICDMIHNKEIYQKLGAKLPKGVLLYGAPGLGKSLMAKCFIEESGLEAYTIRRNKSSVDFVGEITETFNKAKQNSPAIVYLDDMDKFSNEDEMHRDSEEYVAVQSGIDEVRHAEVFVIATVNDIDKLPDSLVRAGRFDRKIEVHEPTEKDAGEIIGHYLKSKKIGESVNLDDVTKMISYSSCAELETILNEAAIQAAFERHEVITMQDITKAVLRMQYDSPDDYSKVSEDELKKVALHEAGHLVVCEVLCPESVGMASIKTSGRNSQGGFIHRCKELPNPMDDVLVSLAGKAAVELYYSENYAYGCQSDINRAFKMIRNEISVNGACGFGMIDVANRRFPDTSESMNSRNEAVVHTLLEQNMIKTRDILLKNREFLEKTTEMLIKKQTILHSDIKALREMCGVVSVEM